jgi:chorismate lyase
VSRRNAGRPPGDRARRPVNSRVRAWVRARGSLTQHLRSARPPLTVSLLGQGLEPARVLDAKALGLRRGSPVHGRTVLLMGRGEGMVLAHSVVRAPVCRGPWRALKGLGQRPLAELLFVRADVHRTPLQQHWLPMCHPLTRWVARRWVQATGQTLPGRGVWRRWSLFSRGGQSLMVSEFFVPGLVREWTTPLRQFAGKYRRSE